MINVNTFRNLIKFYNNLLCTLKRDNFVTSKYWDHQRALNFCSVANLKANKASTFIQDAEDSDSSKPGISKAMKAYLQRAIEHEKFINEKIVEYEIGKRHLANMMGENPDTFTQEDINAAIEYLLPSGLFVPKSRPLMAHPTEVFKSAKEAEFDASGRPFHHLFYTGLPSYYNTLHEIAVRMEHLNNIITKVPPKFSYDELFGSSKWIEQEKVEKILKETISEKQFSVFVASLERLSRHPLAFKIKDFIMKFREEHVQEIHLQDVPQLMEAENGVRYMTAEGKRKTSEASVTVYENGSGQFKVNDQDILYFDNIQDREQIMFPLKVCGLLGHVDIEATATNGGTSGQAGALRYALSMALRSFVTDDVVEKMRIAGLLTKDVRRHERKKPGQKGARAKFTWRPR